MSTLDDLMLDAQRESMLDRCEALHPDEYPDDECPGCAERAELRRQDDEADALAAFVGRDGVGI